MTLLYILFIVQLFLVLYQSVKLRNLQASLRKVQKKSLLAFQKNKALLHRLHLSFETLFERRQLPPDLRNIPWADQVGVVVSVRTIRIPALSSPFNASIGDSENGYRLFFRFDTPIDSYRASQMDNRAPFSSHIGCIELGRNFELLETQFSRIDTGSTFSEDARFFESKGRHFLVYNDLIAHSKEKRGLRIAPINLKTKSLEYVTALNLNQEKMEKNWTPFCFEGEIHFLYTINPQKIYRLPDPQKNQLLLAASSLNEFDWPKMWGVVRGGTPAKLVDGEYLAFFHSFFEDCYGIIWYVMGAYTFKASYPFTMTRISSYPILFDSIYDTIHQSVANPRIRAIYPAGFVFERRKGKDLIHVSCGENDSGVKIVSMDKEMLLATLKCV